MVDVSFYAEAVKQIESEMQWEKEICRKYGVSPEWVSGHIKGLERALEILRVPFLSADEGYK